MKVMCVNSFIDLESGGGTAERTVNLARYLNRNGVQTSILALNARVSENAVTRLNGVELHVLPILIDRYQIPRFSIRSLKKMVASVDIVHMMNHWTPINAIIYTCCRQLHKPYVVCPAGALPIYGRSRFLKILFNQFVGRQIIQHADAHVGITEIERNQFIEYGVEPELVTMIPNGINPEEFTFDDNVEFRNRFAIGNNPFVLFLGRLNHIKGPDLLLDAFARVHSQYPDFHLVFAGPDEGMLHDLKSTAEKVNISAMVHFIGFIGGKVKSQAYHAAELLAVTSRQEAMSIVALEAGSAGTPILLTDVCGLDRIEEVGGGIVVKPTVSDVYRGLSIILKDRRQLIKMGSNWKRFVIDNYTWDVVVSQYIRLFDKIIKADGTR